MTWSCLRRLSTFIIDLMYYYDSHHIGPNQSYRACRFSHFQAMQGSRHHPRRDNTADSFPLRSISRLDSSYETIRSNPRAAPLSSEIEPFRVLKQSFACTGSSFA